MKLLNKNDIKKYLTEFKTHKDYNEIVYGSIIIIFVFSLFWLFLTTSPITGNIEEPFIIEVKKGSSLREISHNLKEEGIIRSETVFNSLVILQRGERKVVSGEYLFHNKPSVYEVIERLTTGDYGILSHTVFIPEGITNAQISKILSQNFVKFDENVFAELTEGKEGRLFPDTYTFLENVKTHEIVEVLEDKFNEEFSKLRPAILATGKTEEEVLIMASIIEEEATAEARQEVSNILWKRIEIDMPLQVDAAFVYERDKNSFTLTKADLVEDSPYNTYTNKGLPPTPISNPSFDSIIAAAFPVPTENLFFLTGHDGEMYYAKTFEQHIKNKNAHLY